MTEPNAKIICHSINPWDEELITLEIEMHRFILPEFNTHRTFSRNLQSSRAIPVLKMLDQIANNPAMPVFYGKNQSGMSAKEELEGKDRELAEMIILTMRDACLNGVKQLQKLNLHKQITNRYIEPWMWTKGIVTATRTAFEAFFKLRSHFAAQPEIQALSDAMRDAIAESTPNKLLVGDWHMPYVKTYKELGIGRNNQVYVQNREEGELTTATALKVSTSCCAQISYRRLDDSLETSERVYNRLSLQAFTDGSDDPPHASPCEHQAVVIDYAELVDVEALDEGYHVHIDCNIQDYTGNFGKVGYYQHRKMLERNDRLFIDKETL